MIINDQFVLKYCFTKDNLAYEIQVQLLISWFCELVVVAPVIVSSISQIHITIIWYYESLFSSELNEKLNSIILVILSFFIKWPVFNQGYKPIFLDVFSSFFFQKEIFDWSDCQINIIIRFQHTLIFIFEPFYLKFYKVEMKFMVIVGTNYIILCKILFLFIIFPSEAFKKLC